MSLYIFSGGKLPQNTEVIISAWNFAPKGNDLLKKIFLNQGLLFHLVQLVTLKAKSLHERESTRTHISDV